MSQGSSTNAEQQIEIAVRDQQAEVYESLVVTRGESWWEIAKQTLLGRLRLRDGESVCDAGCGVGIYTRELVRTFPNSRVVAVDFSQKSLDVLRQHVDSPRLETRCCDLVEFSTDTQFDAILCSEAILHIPSEENRLRAVRNFYDALKPGGRLVLALVPHRPKVHGPDRKVTDGRGKGGYYSYRFTPEEIREIMVATGFSDVHIRGCVNLRGRIRTRLPRTLWWIDVALSRLPISVRTGHLIFGYGVRR